MRLITNLIFIVFFSFSLSAQEDYEITFEHEGFTVMGTFSTPSGPGPFATIIIAPGSGASDRDGTLPMLGGNIVCLYPQLLGDTLRYYKGLGQALVDSGYAVLRYDKLEFSYPTSLGAITFEKLWLPVKSAIDYVKTRSDVDKDRIVLLGHSEGSTLIPFIARDRDDIKALISVGGARTPLDSILAFQLVDFAQRCNGNIPLARSQANAILGYFDLIRKNNWNASTPDLFGVPASTWYDYVQATDPVAENYNENQLPTLFVGMELDINVPPTELLRFEQEVNVTEDFWLIPDLNHYMTTNSDPDVSVVLTDTIIYWLKEQMISTGTKDQLINTQSISIYPNPSFGIATINSQELIQSISIYTLDGRMVRQEVYVNGNVKSQELNMRDLPNGVYLVRVMSTEGVSILKLVKE